MAPKQGNGRELKLVALPVMGVPRATYCTHNSKALVHSEIVFALGVRFNSREITSAFEVVEVRGKTSADSVGVLALNLFTGSPEGLEELFLGSEICP